ncbi:MAG TPA: hypothetical protein VF074_12925 [Pyrinomonadaceae bacterium]
MNQEPNNDIDILLRRLSQRDGNVFNAAQDDEHIEQEHLDADELNAYAENALTSALRTRYTEHLTECTNCRKIVTQLSLASAVVVAERVEEARPSALKKFLAALFSPLVFRYAVPAMAIVVVGAIAWVALQRAPRNSELAQTVPTQPQAQATEEVSNSDNSSKVGQLKEAVSETKESPARAGEKAAATPESELAERQEAIKEDKRAAVAADELRAREDLSKRNPQQPVAPVATGAVATTTAAAPASPKPEVAAGGRLEVAQKKESEADKNKAMNEPQSRTAPPAASTSRPEKAPDAKADQKTGESDTAASRRDLRDFSRAKDEPQSGEVRTVGGHRFRKRGDVWIDTLYSSQRITNVSRGSEQYRALVADEPGLHSIAEHLKSEFIVVWNGRAYFIK